MDKAIEAMLAASVLLTTTGSALAASEKLAEGVILIAVGTALIFLRGYIKQK